MIYKGYDIRWVDGHYEAFLNDVFIVSGDTDYEVKGDIDKLLQMEEQ
jgi:hypothetical protein